MTLTTVCGVVICGKIPHLLVVNYLTILRSFLTTMENIKHCYTFQRFHSRLQKIIKKTSIIYIPSSVVECECEF